jgi:hypothetical protein
MLSSSNWIPIVGLAVFVYVVFLLRKCIQSSRPPDREQPLQDVSDPKAVAFSARETEFIQAWIDNHKRGDKYHDR